MASQISVPRFRSKQSTNTSKATDDGKRCKANVRDATTVTGDDFVSMDKDINSIQEQHDEKQKIGDNWMTMMVSTLAGLAWSLIFPLKRFFSDDTNSYQKPDHKKPAPTDSEPRFTFANIIKMLEVIPWFYKMTLLKSPFLWMSIVIIDFVQGVIPVYTTAANAKLIDAVAQIMTDKEQGSISDVITHWATVHCVLQILEQLVALLREAIYTQLKNTIESNFRALTLEQMTRLDLSYFEDPQYSSIIDDRRHDYYSMTGMKMVSYIMDLGQCTVTLISRTVILTRQQIHWSIVPVAVCYPVVSMAFEMWERLQWTRRIEETKDIRINRQYLYRLITGDGVQMELKSFDLGHLFIEHLTRLDQILAARKLRDNMFDYFSSFTTSTFTYMVYCYMYTKIAMQAIDKEIGVGDVTVFISTANDISDTCKQLLWTFRNIYSICHELVQIHDFLSWKPKIVSPPDAVPYSTAEKEMRLENEDAHEFIGMGMHFEFREVSFRYPGATEDCLRNINLIVRPGEHIGIVGANGAGKSTLTKLLLRLYEPTSGTIFVNKHPIQHYDLSELRARIAPIFQDFQRYQLMVRDNIGFGDAERVDDLERIQEAARKGGADKFIEEKLEAKYEQKLSHSESKLSGGEWQRLALARAFMRNDEARLIVLDEPTAALVSFLLALLNTFMKRLIAVNIHILMLAFRHTQDALAEHQLFQRIRDLARHKTAVFVSHRFSTVKQADRIIVLADGTIAEQGSHDELMQLNEIYAKLFRMQAEAYV
ncbi:P-loop containing nucleoside triphosphate hydrolase protein [Jimgerdemannia flammicorona]|uniref:P-loop containing nucleoside triphosphate hydrolase protein n=1 Tax=Jimgerdemannia flammicorona TaxID=994334 RepID=A0A433DC45_9FUNG|nr:P-loop containing nucleoside triphosphate hydrolase protein [Jimgerdemannia flammicorona]